MEIVWRKSRKCASNACVEVAEQPTAFLVRDSKNADGPILTFSRSDWGAFVGTLKKNNL